MKISNKAEACYNEKMEKNKMKIWDKIKGKTLRVTAAILALPLIAATVSTQGVVYAYGPERPTYTIAKPADHVVFNSITDNPVVGDERDFVRVMEVGSEKYVNEVEAKVGKVYQIYAAYHNNAASNLNPSGKGIARGTRMGAEVPKSLKKNEKTKIAVMITADNAEPKSVWDEAYLIAKEDGVKLQYVKDSATIHTKAKNKKGETVNGQKLVGIFSVNGAKLGVSKLDGLLPGCAEYSGYVTFQVKAVKDNGGTVPDPSDDPKPTPAPEKPKGEGKLEKTVSKDGVKFERNIEASEAEEVHYRVVFENPSKAELKRVVLMDEMDAKMELMNETVKIVDGEGKAVKTDSFINSRKVEIASLAAGKKIQIDYKARVKNLDCGENRMVNTVKASFEYDGADKVQEDSKKALVKADKSCSTPLPTPTPTPTPTEPIPDRLPNTGPKEIIFFTVLMAGIGGGVFYFYKTKRKVKQAMRSAGVVKPIEPVVGGATGTDATMSAGVGAELSKVANAMDSNNITMESVGAVMNGVADLLSNEGLRNQVNEAIEKATTEMENQNQKGMESSSVTQPWFGSQGTNQVGGTERQSSEPPKPAGWSDAGKSVM